MGTEPSADTAGPVDQSRSMYSAVVTLIGLAMGLLPSLVTIELELHVVIPYASQNPISTPLLLFQIVEVGAFLISPCLFFVILYLYGRRRARLFNENHLRVIPFLFFGSALGYAVFMSLLPLIEGEAPVLNTTFWFGFAFGLVSEGVRDAFVGFAALALSYLRAGNLASPSIPA